MKRWTMVLLMMAAALMVLTGCGAQNNATPTTAPTEALAEATEAPAEEATAEPEGAGTSEGTEVFTTESLAAYNGKDGARAYVAVDGVVYDVTDVEQWKDGEHYEGMEAGKDLTEEIKKQSPHGVSVLEGLPVVGTLAQ